MSGLTDRMSQHKMRFVDVDGIRTRFYEDGEGESIVLVHGGQFSEFSSLDKWSRNVDMLATRFHVYAVDKLGQGYTDNPTRDEDYCFDALYEHFYGFLRAVGVHRAHVVGHSRGGLLVTWHALNHPDMVHSLAIVDSSSTAPDDPGALYTRFYDERDKRVAGLDRESPEYLRVVLGSNSYSDAHVTGELVEVYQQIARLEKTRRAQERYRYTKESVWLPSVGRCKSEVLRRIDEDGIRIPVRVVWGADDPSAPLYLGYRLFDRLSAKGTSVGLHVLNRAGHPVFRERAEAFNRLLLGVL